jgi:hypothetical protein
MKTKRDEERKNDLLSILHSHDTYWDNEKPRLKRYRDVYHNKFWNEKVLHDYGQKEWIPIETSYAYTFIEMYVNGLLLKAPSVFVNADPLSANYNKTIEVLVNNWLTSKRVQLEDATKKALIYPCSFVKVCMGHFDEKDPYSIINAPYLEVIDPWDVIVDEDQSSFERMRYFGHRYYMTVSEAKEKWGNKKWRPVVKNEYFSEKNIKGSSIKEDDIGLSDNFKYICVVEFYDLMNDRLYIFSENTSSGFTMLENDRIPLRDSFDKPILTIAPLYLNYNIDEPLRGMSTLQRVYDPIVEVNIVRSKVATYVRMFSEKFIYNKAAGEELVSGLLSNNDKEYIGVDMSASTLANMVYKIPDGELPEDIYRYLSDKEKAINEATILAPTARGEPIDPTRTATEINYMMSSTGSELNKMTRMKDELIQKLAHIVIRLFYTYLKDGDNLTVSVDGKAHTISRKNLSSNFTYVAIDQGNSPIAQIQRRQSLAAMAQQLVALGAQPSIILEQIVSEFGFDKSIIPAATPATSKTAEAIDTSKVASSSAAGPTQNINSQQAGGY